MRCTASAHTDTAWRSYTHLPPQIRGFLDLPLLRSWLLHKVHSTKPADRHRTGAHRIFEAASARSERERLKTGAQEDRWVRSSTIWPGHPPLQTLRGWIRFIEAMSPHLLPASGMRFDKCDSTPIQDYNGDNSKEHLLLDQS